MKTIIFEIFRVHNTPNGTVVLSIFSVFYYGKMVVRYYYQFFQFLIMGKMVICSMYIIWKNFPLSRLHKKTQYYFVIPIIHIYNRYHL
jgi:hypothetical protein